MRISDSNSTLGTRDDENYFVRNAGGTPSIQEGPLRSIPKPGVAGRLYLSTDQNIMYRDTGSKWLPLMLSPNLLRSLQGTFGFQGIAGLEILARAQEKGSIVWADSSASLAGEGGTARTFNSLQAAIDSAVNNEQPNFLGVAAPHMILIAANSTFDEDITVPRGKNIQLYGMGPWMIGGVDASTGELIRRNVILETSATNTQAFKALDKSTRILRTRAVIGTLGNATSVGTNRRYAMDAIVSGDIIIRNTSGEENNGFSKAERYGNDELQLHNTNVLGTIRQEGPSVPFDLHSYNSSLMDINHKGLRIKRMVDSGIVGEADIEGYSYISNSYLNGNVNVSQAFNDVPPAGIFNSQFGTITWNGPLVLDGASNYYFVNSDSQLIGGNRVLLFDNTTV